MFEHLTHELGRQVVELTELHRFTHKWEAAATLPLRAGDPGVLATYAERGRVHPGASSEDAADAVFDRWHHATIKGADALMLARAWTDVNALNARARAVAIATGAVTGPDLAIIATRSASTRAQIEHRSWRAGDVLLAKKNNSRTHIGGETLRHDDRFRVLTASDTGGLVVADLSGRGTLTLPDAYLARNAEYGWAATIDGAQGATADIGIVLARAGLDREQTVTKRFRELSAAAGVPMAVVSKRLGHSSLAITSDTYSHLLEGVGQQAAIAAAALVPRTDRRTQNEPRSAPNRPGDTGASGIDAGHGVGRLGIEPRTRGLKVRCSAG